MSEIKINEQELITNPELRSKHINRVEVLNKVGELLLLPNTELATTKQVADFYDVDVEAIKWHIKSNREELEDNGMKLMPYREIKALVNGEFDPLYKISKRGATVFTPRTILLIGFMLRDSKVAQEVRNQALNIIENATDEQKTFEITKEKELLMAIMFAENEVERATAINVHLEYVNRHKKMLEEKIEKQNKVIEHKQGVIEGLTDHISLTDKRQILNKVIRAGCNNSFAINSRWNFLYEQFEMIYHINVRVRKNNFEKKTGVKISVLDYVEKHLNMFDELYELAIKLFSIDAEKILKKYQEALFLDSAN